jgi:hypothetical protein
VNRVQALDFHRHGRDQILQALIDLGLRFPRGPSLKNEGTHKKRYFEPHALWEGDGKTIKVHVNGEVFSFCWYAFIDQNTTLLVGSSLTGFESAASFLQALKDGKDRVGFMATGVLIDNRLTNEDKVSVKEFCQEHGIVLVNTFPGNSKSNGIIEGNFSIFEKQVGEVHVSGQTPEELARSLARNVIEIFTQQRNHGPRKRLEGQTPAEATAEAERPEHQKSALERLRDRLLREELSVEAKMQLIQGWLAKFEPMDEESLAKFRAQLKQFSADEIIAARARFSAQQSKRPDQFYRSEYFLAILRYKREEGAKDAFNAAFRAGHEALNRMASDDLKTRDLSQVATKIVAFLAVCADRPGRSHLLMSLESLCFGLLDFVPVARLPELWQKIELAARRSREISLAKWQIMAEFVGERLGQLLFPTGSPPVFAGAANNCEVQI